MRRIALLILALTFVACGEQEKVLRFTAIPDQNTTALRKKFDPVAEYLSEKLGVKVEYVPSDRYQASVEMFKNGDVHMAWFGGLTGVQARRAVEGARAIVQGAEDPTFRSYFIAHRDTELAPSETLPEEIAKLRFTFGSNSSTSGRLMPEFYILQAFGKTAAEFFEQAPGFSGSHDTTAELVASGKYQVGAINFQVYERRVKAFRENDPRDERKTDPGLVRVIWQTPDYADYNMTAHPALEEIFKEGFIGKLQQALLDIDREDLLGAFGRTRLIPAKNEEFDGIRDVALKLGMLR